MAADMEVHLVPDIEVDRVADIVADEKEEEKKGTQFGERRHANKKKKKGFPIW